MVIAVIGRPGALVALAACVLLGSCSSGLSAEDAALCANVACTVGVCRVVDGHPICHCSAWDLAAGAPCDEAGYQIGDAGFIGHAGERVGLVAPAQSGTLHKSGIATQADRFEVKTLAGDDYQFSVSPQSGGVTWTIEAYDESGALLDSATAISATSLTVHSDPAQVLRFQVSRGPGFEATEGVYSWSFSETNPLNQGGPGHSTATISVGQTVTDRIDFNGDVDAFLFEGTAEHAYQFTLSAQEAAARLELRDQSGTVLQQSGQVSVGGGMVPGFVYLAHSDWTAYVTLLDSAVTDVRYDRGITYTIDARELSVDVVGDTPAQATTIALDTDIAGRLDVPSDVDVYAFSTVAGHSYWLQASPPQAVQAGLIGVPGDGSVLQASSSDVGYVRISTGFGDYSFKVRDIGTDEAGELPSGARSLDVGTSVEGFIEPVGDIDDYVIDAGFNQFVFVSTTCSGVDECAPYPTNWSFFKQVSGELLGAQGRHGPASWVVKVPVDGPLFVRLVGGFPYQLTISDGGFDDYGNDPGHATPLALDSTATGIVEWGTDTDVFETALDAGTHYLIEIDGGVGAWIKIDGNIFAAGEFITAADSGVYDVFVSAPQVPVNFDNHPYELRVTTLP